MTMRNKESPARSIDFRACRAQSWLLLREERQHLVKLEDRDKGHSGAIDLQVCN